jgi:hypothetical protein
MSAATSTLLLIGSPLHNRREACALSCIRSDQQTGPPICELMMTPPAARVAGAGVPQHWQTLAALAFLSAVVCGLL